MRLIDADALMKVIREHDYPLRSLFNSTDNGMFTIGVQQAVDEAPTIEAVPVVRCGECAKQFMPDCPLQIIEKHEQRFICQNDSDFCSYGAKEWGKE